MFIVCSFISTVLSSKHTDQWSFSISSFQLIQFFFENQKEIKFFIKLKVNEVMKSREVYVTCMMMSYELTHD